MPIGSGLGGSLGIAAEGAGNYGTFTTPTRFPEVEMAPLKRRKKVVQGTGLAAGRTVDPGARRVVTTHDAGGSIKSELVDSGAGLLLAHALGSTAVPVQYLATTAYIQTHNLGDPFGLSLTAQIGLPGEDGVVHPYSYLGCKITDAEWACALDGLLVATYTVDARDVSEAQSLTSPTYPATAKPFNFSQANVKIGTFGAEATVEGVRSVTLKLARTLRTDRYYQDGSGLKKEPVLHGVDKITGTLDVDFITKADFADRFVSDAGFSLIWDFVGAAIGASGKNSEITFNCPQAYLDDTFDLNGPDIVTGSIPFTVQYDGSHPALSVVYTSADSTL